MSARHRLFFALVPEARVRQQVAAVQHRLNCDGREVKPANLHVTLAFLGMQEAAAVPAVLVVADRLRFQPCRVVLDSLGQFGRGRVLWLGASCVPAPLASFQLSLMAALGEAGIGHDPKPWQLHLTLYRRLRTPPPKLDPVAIEWDLAGFDLVESVGSRSGVEYRSIGHWQGAP